MADLRTDYEVSQKQVEVDLLHQQKKNQQIIVIATVIALVLIFIMAVGLYRRYNFIKATNKIIEKEKSRSDNLLLNILPEETAHELKENGKVLAKKFESVTVLFTDFKGFTQYAENLSPEKLVESVDFYFSKFDEIMGKYDLEKIKTVGDAYMCAGGLPFPTADHAHKMVQAAFEIADFVNESKKIHAANEIRFDIRIGINTGPVVAGVVGSRKFSYDIWGDTVNIASRMESNSEPGKINISANTYELIKDTFDCDYRGEIEVKNRGMMKMYFVNSIKQTTI
jgi:class 3 adenylate cyclase